MVYKKAGAFFNCIDDFVALFEGYRWATVASTAKGIIEQEIVADVIRAMQNNATGKSFVIDPSFYPTYL